MHDPVEDAKEKVMDALDKHSEPLSLGHYIDLMKSVREELEIRLDAARSDLQRQHGTD